MLNKVRMSLGAQACDVGGTESNALVLVGVGGVTVSPLTLLFSRVCDTFHHKR